MTSEVHKPMYFESELAGIGENIPTFELNSDKIEVLELTKSNETDLSIEKVLKCPECDLRFIYLASFMRICGKHLSDFPNDESGGQNMRCQEQNSTLQSQNTPPKRHKQKKRQLDEDFTLRKLPIDYFFYCKLCRSVTRSYKGYREHLMGHRDPSLKYCQICEMEFASFTSCKNHKAKLHPTMYKQEIQQRKDDAKKFGRNKFIYNIIHKSKIIQEVADDEDRSTSEPKPQKPHPKELKIVLECICLPGFLRNDWISLPKNESDYPWIVPRNEKPFKTRIKYKSPVPVPIKEESESDDDDFSWPMNEESEKVEPLSALSAVYRSKGSRQWRNKNDEYLSRGFLKETKVIPKDLVNKWKEEKSDDDDFDMIDDPIQEVSDVEEIGLESHLKIDIETDIKKQRMKPEEMVIKPDIHSIKGDDDDFSWPMDVNMNDESNLSSQNLQETSKLRMTRHDDIPQFRGANYLFNVYDNRYYWRNKLFKIRRKLGLVTPKTGNNTEKTPKRRRVVKTCQICNAVRSQARIRGHVATHYYEESETECRICGCKESGKKLKAHYTSAHNVNIHAELMKEQRERMEKGLEDGSDYVTCSICYTNLKTDEHLKYHVEMLHEYDPRGGQQKQPDLVKECTICDRKYKSRQLYRKHLRKFHPELLFEGKETIICDECGKTFYLKGFFKHHFFMAHRKHLISGKNKPETEDKSIICDKCGRIIKQKRTFGQHKCEFKGTNPKIRPPKVTEEDRVAHQSITDFSSAYCPVCDKHLSSAYNFKEHCRLYSEETFVCEVPECQKYFPSRSLYQRHKKFHKFGYLCKCRCCEETFDTFESRQKHETEVHNYVNKTGVRAREPRGPYEKPREACLAHQSITDFTSAYCHLCDKKFASKYNFRDHCQSFTNQEFIDCEFPGCYGRFTSKLWYKKHLQRHVTPNTFNCRCCEESFSDFRHRIKHEMEVHSFNYKEQPGAKGFRKSK